MNRQQIRDFIFLASDQNIPFYFVDPKLYPPRAFIAAIVPNKRHGKQIVIDKYRWEEYTKDEQKLFLLHEIGHVKDPNFKWDREFAKGELFAQQWAIQKANQLGLLEIAIKGIRMLREWEKCYHWNGDGRCYILASKMAKQQGLI